MSSHTIRFDLSQRPYGTFYLVLYCCFFKVIFLVYDIVFGFELTKTFILITRFDLNYFRFDSPTGRGNSLIHSPKLCVCVRNVPVPGSTGSETPASASAWPSRPGCGKTAGARGTRPRRTAGATSTAAARRTCASPACPAACGSRPRRTRTGCWRRTTGRTGTTRSRTRARPGMGPPRFGAVGGARTSRSFLCTSRAGWWSTPGGSGENTYKINIQMTQRRFIVLDMTAGLLSMCLNINWMFSIN